LNRSFEHSGELFATGVGSREKFCGIEALTCGVYTNFR
jgi:hypothetical protein